MVLSLVPSECDGNMSFIAIILQLETLLHAHCKTSAIIPS